MTTTGNSDIGKQRAAVAILFFVLGAAVGSWVTRIPEVQAALKINDKVLGYALLMSAVGGLIAMPLAGRLAPYCGTRGMALGAALAMCVALPAIPLAPSLWVLMIALAVWGASTGVLGVAINALAVYVEERVGRPILSSFHGLFSLGCLVGSGVASGLLDQAISPVNSLAGAALVLGLTLIATVPILPAAPTETSARRLSRPPRGLLILGLLAFLGFVGEGSMADWSALYLKRSLAAPASVTALGFAAYSLGMTVGRFMGDRITQRFGDETVVRGGAGLAAAGLATALLLRNPSVAIIGFSLVGAGLANVVPVLFRAAARVPGIAPVAGIATASTIGYLGFLTGPPMIGRIAHSTSLPIALALVATAIACVAMGGGAVNNVQSDIADESSPRLMPHENAIASASEA